MEKHARAQKSITFLPFPIFIHLNCISNECLSVDVGQSFCRGWMQRKELFLQKDAAIKIQTAFRCMSCRRSFISQRLAATDIQRFVRGQATRRRLLGENYSIESLPSVVFLGFNPNCFIYMIYCRIYKVYKRQLPRS